MRRILCPPSARRAVVCLAVLGTLVAASIGLAPGAHALAAAPSVAATVHALPGGYDVIAIGGDGFTAGATVSIVVTDTATAAVLATIVVPDVATTAATAKALVCTGFPVFFFGLPFAGLPVAGQSCQIQLVQISGTAPGVDATIAATFTLKLSTRAVTIVAVDSATGMASNRVALTF